MGSDAGGSGGGDAGGSGGKYGNGGGGGLVDGWMKYSKKALLTHS